MNFTPNVLHEVIAQYVAEAKEYVLPESLGKSPWTRASLEVQFMVIRFH